MGKVELSQSGCLIFFSRMFIELFSVFHTNCVRIAEFEWLSARHKATIFRVKYLKDLLKNHKHGVQCMMISVVNFFVFSRLLFFALLLLYVTYVETIFHLSYVLTASGNLF